MRGRKSHIFAAQWDVQSVLVGKGKVGSGSRNHQAANGGCQRTFVADAEFFAGRHFE
jgi:hypothetical protein